MSGLSIENLNVFFEDTQLLHDVSLTLPAGAMHAIIGESGSGKTTLIRSVMNVFPLVKTSGTITWHDRDITSLPSYTIAQLGIFPWWQDPVEINGVAIGPMLHKLYVNHQEARGDEVVLYRYADFTEFILPIVQRFGHDESWLDAVWNAGFSVDEKYILELVQIVLLEPDLVLLDDIPATVKNETIDHLVSVLVELQKNKKTVLLLTNNQKLFKKITPEVVHVIDAGVITASYIGEDILKAFN